MVQRERRAVEVEAYVNDPWVVRRLPAMIASAGFAGGRIRSHGFVQLADADYMLSIADRGADALAASGWIGPELVTALKGEARRRLAEGTFFRHIAYATVLATKP